MIETGLLNYYIKDIELIKKIYLPSFRHLWFYFKTQTKK